MQRSRTTRVISAASISRGSAMSTVMLTAVLPGVRRGERMRAMASGVTSPRRPPAAVRRVRVRRARSRDRRRGRHPRVGGGRVRGRRRACRGHLGPRDRRREGKVVLFAAVAALLACWRCGPRVRRRRGGDSRSSSSSSGRCASPSRSSMPSVRRTVSAVWRAWIVWRGRSREARDPGGWCASNSPNCSNRTCASRSNPGCGSRCSAASCSSRVASSGLAWGASRNRTEGRGVEAV